MSVLPIVTGEDTPILREKTKKIPKVTKEILALIGDMMDTVKAAPGAGIAAPQVNSSHRLCLASINNKMTVLINPEITWKSEEQEWEEEGCLSLPGLVVPVRRSKAIRVCYVDEKGKEQERKLKDWSARVVQHEVDHLNGVLIADYLPPSLTTEKRAMLQKK